MKREIRRAILSRRFCIAALVLLTGYWGYSVPSWAFSADWGYEFRESALHLSLGGIYYGSVILLLPFCVCIPYATVQVDEIKSGYFRYAVMRHSVYGYVLSRVAAGMVSSAVLAGGTFLFHAALWNVVGIPYNPVVNPYHEMNIPSVCLYYGFDKMLNAIPIYAYFAVSMGICAAIWSVAALAVAVWMADKMLTMVIPVCIYRLWSSGIPYYLLGVDLPHPSAMFNDGLTYETFKYSLAAYLVLFVLSFLCYFCGVSKRGTNA